MKKHCFLLSFFLPLIFITLFLQSCEESKVEKTNEPVWSDEFDYKGAPDSTKWGYDIGNGCPKLCGWGNNQLEHYTDRARNVRVENGKLIIEAHKEDFGDMHYTSTRLVSRHKGDWKYGRIEIMANLPKGKGTWPAIWMLPTDWEYGGWPASGEIDIMEHVGYSPDSIFGTVHTQSFNHINGTEVGEQRFIPTSENEFHLYAIEWTNEKIDFFIDQEKYFTFKNQGKSFAEYPFDKKFYLILNIAVGGNWGGKHGVDESIFPVKMEVDYVRVYNLQQLESQAYISQK